MALNTWHFEDKRHYDKLWEQMRRGLDNGRDDVIAQARQQLLNLFDDAQGWIESHEDMNKAIDIVQKHIETKIHRARNINMIHSWRELWRNLQNLRYTYNHLEEVEQKAQHNDCVQKIRQLYDKITIIMNQSDIWSESVQDNESSKDEWSQAQTQSQQQSNTINQSFNFNFWQTSTWWWNSSSWGKQDSGSWSSWSKSSNPWWQKWHSWTKKPNNKPENSSNDIEDIDYEELKEPTKTQSPEASTELEDLHKKFDELTTTLKELKKENKELEKQSTIEELKQQLDEQNKQHQELLDELRKQQQENTDKYNESNKEFFSDLFDKFREENKHYLDLLKEEKDKCRELFKELLDDKKKKEKEKEKEDEEDTEDEEVEDMDISIDTSWELFNLFTIDSYLMDTETIIHESEKKRIKQESEREREHSSVFKKPLMYLTNRKKQERLLQDSMTQARNEDEFIKNWKLQDRVEWHIGTYAQEHRMGIESSHIQAQEAFSDDRVNRIANDYLHGLITRTQAKAELNKALSAIKQSWEADWTRELGEMTWSDIITRLDDNRRDFRIENAIAKVITDPKKHKTLSSDHITKINKILATTLNTDHDTGSKLATPSNSELQHLYESLTAKLLQEKIDKIDSATLWANIQLIGLIKDPDAEDLEGVNYDNINNNKLIQSLSKWVRAMWRPWRIGAKFAVWLLAWAASGWTAWIALAGAAWAWALLQYFKTYGDSTDELIAMHKDLINLWPEELARRLEVIQHDIEDLEASNRKQFLSIFGINKLSQRRKQKHMIEALSTLSQDNATIGVEDLTHRLRNARGEEREHTLAEALSYIDTNHSRRTNLITTNDRAWNPLWLEETAVRHNILMRQLEQTAISTPLSIYDGSWVRHEISVDNNSTPEQRNIYRKYLKGDASSTYHAFYTHLNESYDRAEQSIKSKRRRIWTTASGHYLAKVAAVSGIGGLVSLWSGLFGESGELTNIETTPEGTSHDILTEQWDFHLSEYENTAHVQTTWEIPQDAQISEVQIDVGVDEVAAKLGAYDDYLDHIQNTRDTISWLNNLHTDTLKTLQDAISDTKIQEIYEHAKQFTDEWNAKLFALRRNHAVESFAQHLHDHDLTSIKVDSIEFNDDLNSLLSARQSISGWQWDIAHRGYELLIKAKDIQTWWGVDTPVEEASSSRIRWTIPPLLPYENTYARPWSDRRQHHNPDQQHGFWHYFNKKYRTQRKLEKIRRQNQQWKLSLEKTKAYERWLPSATSIQKLLDEQEKTLKDIEEAQQTIDEKTAAREESAKRFKHLKNLKKKLEQNEKLLIKRMKAIA